MTIWINTYVKTIEELRKEVGLLRGFKGANEESLGWLQDIFDWVDNFETAPEDEFPYHDVESIGTELRHWADDIEGVQVYTRDRKGDRWTYVGDRQVRLFERDKWTWDENENLKLVTELVLED